MKKHLQKISWRLGAVALGVVMLGTSLLVVQTANAKNAQDSLTTTSALKKQRIASSVNNTQSTKQPKYVFLFIGDGMGFAQIQSASYYLGAKENNTVESKDLSFMKYPVSGSVKTYDKTSFAPDSASTATSIATGNKTYSGTINMDTTMTKSFETIAEKLKKQKDYKIGIITSVNLNHATPGAFYAHQPSRGNYYEIGEEMINSNFDYFAGGALLSPTGKDEKSKNIYDVAQEKGYKIVKTDQGLETLKPSDGKSIVIAEQLADNDAIKYQIDAKKNDTFLADYVKKGIEMLDNDKGFFMMVEGGKIDWACHANDATTSIHDTIAFDNAVKEAYAFYEKHPDETLIIVTADHETGGMSIGYAGLDYDTYLKNLENQKISYAEFDTQYVTKYKENNTSFADVLKDIQAQFGLATKENPGNNKTLVLSDYEYKQLEKAYERTLGTGAGKKDTMSQEEYLLYGTYEPLTVTITHILNNKSGMSFTSYAHTGLPVPIFAIGSGQDEFAGYYDNTDVYKNMATVLNVK